MRLMFCKIWEKIGKNVSFWCISKLGVQMFMKLWYLMLFFVFRKRQVVAGRLCFFFYMRSFSKIDFPDSLTVRFSSNLYILFITCYFVVWPVGSSIKCMYLEKCVTHYCSDFGFVIIIFFRNFGVRIMVVCCAWLYGIAGT